MNEDILEALGIEEIPDEQEIATKQVCQEVVSAEAVFEELAKQIRLQPKAKEESKENTKENVETEKQDEEPQRKKRRYIGKSARINAELMKEVLRELKYIASTSYQPDVVKSAERAARFLKVIIAENEDLFPGVLKPKS